MAQFECDKCLKRFEVTEKETIKVMSQTWNFLCADCLGIPQSVYIAKEVMASEVKCPNCGILNEAQCTRNGKSEFYCDACRYVYYA